MEFQLHVQTDQGENFEVYPNDPVTRRGLSRFIQTWLANEDLVIGDRLEIKVVGTPAEIRQQITEGMQAEADRITREANKRPQP